MDPQNFFAELKRRNIYKVAVAYVLAAWLIIQIATQVFPVFEIPNRAVQLVVLGFIIGFPIVLVLTWAFELVPERIRLDEGAGSGYSVASQSGRKLTALVVVLAAVAAAMMLFRLIRTEGQNDTGRPTHRGSTELKSIAILPFENLSDDKENGYFVSGMRDEILTSLAQLRDLNIRSRTSTQNYESHPADLRAISRDLNVAAVLEGSVQKAGDDVLINVQLIDARTRN